MHLVNVNQPLTMSHIEIAEVTKKRPDHVKRTIETLYKNGLIAYSQSVGVQKGGNNRNYETVFYHVGKRDSYVVVAQLSPEFTAALVDRWQELENRNIPQLPQTFAEALQLAADQAKQLELQAPKVEFHDTVTQSEHTYKYQEAGKKIQQRPNKFVAWLRDNAYIDKLNTPYQRYISQGLFKMHTGVNGDTGHEYTQGRVTTKGLSYFTNKLEGVKL